MIKGAAILGSVAAAATALPALAQMEPATPTKACAPGPVALPEALAGWAKRSPLPAAKTLSGSARARLVPGEAVDAALIATPMVDYATRPEKPGGSVSYGGLFSFTIKEDGMYRVALGSGAWIDIIADGKPVTSSAHGHGPDCSGIRKMVDFPLAPGDYVLQIAANGSPALPLMLARLP